MKGYSENQTNSLNDKQIQACHNQGYLAIGRLIDTSDLDLLIHVVSDVVDRKARHFYKVRYDF